MTQRNRFFVCLAVVFATLSACQGQADTALPGNAQDSQPYSEIAGDEALRLAGTEPFWGGTIADGILTYTTPENPVGTQLEVERFAGRGGLSFSGETADGLQVDVAITPGDCSDGMSGRTYPFAATLNWGAEQRRGCAWSDAQPHTGGED